jgi:hypothetical protein
MQALLVAIEHAALHYRVKAARRGNEPVQAAVARGLSTGGLDETASHTPAPQHAASIDQEQPRVLADGVRPRIPRIAMLRQNPTQGRRGHL